MAVKMFFPFLSLAGACDIVLGRWHWLGMTPFVGQGALCSHLALDPMIWDSIVGGGGLGVGEGPKAEGTSQSDNLILSDSSAERMR